MYFSQHYLDCLSQASYLIGDETSGQAVIVDPRRDVADYLDDASANGLTIIGIINTHFHADFLSGHLEIARETGAWIGYGAAARPEFEVRSLSDGERISLGDVTLQIRETPGHTPESISILVYEHADDDTADGVLTGDALFFGDVGRPDLLASVGVTADELGRAYVPDPQAYFLAHEDDVERASRLTTTQVRAVIASGDVQVVDIRNAGELESGMLPNALHLPLAELARRIAELDPSRQVVVYCAGGWRSSVAASLLRAQGFSDVSDVLGGYGAWERVHAVAS